MLRVPTAASFLADPVGHCYVGRRFCVFAHAPTLLGFSSWGRPDVQDVTELLQACAFGLGQELAPYRWLVDLRDLELIEPGTFGLFVEYTRKNAERLRRNIQRQAIVRPDGFIGAILSGFSHIARLSYPDRVFRDVDETLAWLDVAPAEGIPLLAELEAIRRGSRESHSVVARLMEELEASGPVPIEVAARRLAFSTRSLQRALREAGTTYRMELKAFRVRRAQQLLRGDQNLGTIAAEVGFSSTQHFATAYRRAMGETPSEWRLRNRKPV